jgi:hypothetical protein
VKVKGSINSKDGEDWPLHRAPAAPRPLRRGRQRLDAWEPKEKEDAGTQVNKVPCSAAACLLRSCCLSHTLWYAVFPPRQLDDAR